MTATTANAHLNYDLYVAQAGAYQIGLRVAGAAGNITLLDGTTPLSTVYETAGPYRTLSTEIYLGPGYDSLTLQLQNPGQVVDYLDINPVLRSRHPA